jgi:hypothetical protein
MPDLPRKVKLPSGDVIEVDFSEDEMERRMAEVIRRMIRPPRRPKPVFNLETGQNYEPPFLSDDELRRRGYDVPARK